MKADLLEFHHRQRSQYLTVVFSVSSATEHQVSRDVIYKYDT